MLPLMAVCIFLTLKYSLLLRLAFPESFPLCRRIDQFLRLLKRRRQVILRPFFSGFFLLLDLLPLCQDYTLIRDDRLSEHMGMTADHLVDDRLDHVIHGKISLFLRDPRVHHHLHEQVAQLFL